MSNAQKYKKMIDKTISFHDIEEMKNLSVTLGLRILKARFHSQDDGAEQKKLLDIASSNLKSTIESFFENERNKYTLTIFGAHLLQYYTFLCEPDASTKIQLKDLQSWLSSKANDYANSHSNLFLIEHKIILTFNELNEISNQLNSGHDVRDVEDETRYLIRQLIDSGQILEKYASIYSEKHVFLSYLKLYQNYVLAKACELLHKFNALQDGNTQNSAEITSKQQRYLQNAKSNFDNLEHDYNKEKLDYTKGLEYFLGKEVLSSFPLHDFTACKSHLNELVNAYE